MNKDENIYERTKLNENKPYKFCISARSANKIKELYIIIKYKRDNACLDRENGQRRKMEKDILLGEISAYNDILSLMEKMFEVNKDGKNDNNSKI